MTNQNFKQSLENFNQSLKDLLQEVKELQIELGVDCNLCQDKKEVYKHEDSDEMIPCPDCQKAEYKDDADFSNASSPTGEVE